MPIIPVTRRLTSDLQTDLTTRQSSYSKRNRQGAELQHGKLNCPPAASRWLNRNHLDVEIVIINRGIVRIFRRLNYLPATPARLPADALVLPADAIAGRRFEHPLQLILAEWLNRDHLDIEMVVFTRRIDRIKLPSTSPLHFLPRLYPFQRPHVQDESSSLQVRAYCIIPGTTTTAIAASLMTRYHQTLCATNSRSRKMNDQTCIWSSSYIQGMDARASGCVFVNVRVGASRKGGGYHVVDGAI